MNNKKLLPLLGIIGLLAGCTKMENFSTDHVLNDVTGKNTAKIKVTTNIPYVFAIPDYACITLDENKARKINTTFSRKGTDDWAMWGKTDTLPIKEYSEKTLGMKSISLDKSSELKNILPNKVKSYSSYEYEVNAGMPITFFIKTSLGSSLLSYFELFTKDSEELFSLSSSFIPEKNKEYQLFVTFSQEETLVSYNQRRTDYKYSFNLFDITQGNLHPQNSMMRKVNVCPKEGSK